MFVTLVQILLLPNFTLGIKTKQNSRVLEIDYQDYAIDNG